MDSMITKETTIQETVFKMLVLKETSGQNYSRMYRTEFNGKKEIVIFLTYDENDYCYESEFSTTGVRLYL